MEIDLIVSRHKALVEFLALSGLTAQHVIEHATPEDVKDKVVAGVLPHHLSCLTKVYIEVPIHVPPKLRGVELSLDQIRQYAGNPPMRAYVVNTFEAVSAAVGAKQ